MTVTSSNSVPDRIRYLPLGLSLSSFLMVNGFVRWKAINTPPFFFVVVEAVKTWGYLRPKYFGVDCCTK